MKRIGCYIYLAQETVPNPSPPIPFIQNWPEHESAVIHRALCQKHSHHLGYVGEVVISWGGEAVIRPFKRSEPARHRGFCRMPSHDWSHGAKRDRRSSITACFCVLWKPRKTTSMKNAHAAAAYTLGLYIFVQLLRQGFKQLLSNWLRYLLVCRPLML